MQTQGGSDAEAAILAPERRFKPKVMVDWNRNGLYNHALSDMSQYVSMAETDRSLQGSAPTQLNLIEGSAAAELTLVVGGDYTTDYSIADIFSPYQANSPFYNTDIIGVEVSYSIGLETAVGTVWYPQFIGFIRFITPDRGSNSVEIKALDRVELLRRPVSFAPFAMFEWHAVVEGAAKAQLMDTQWFIDHCLRGSGISPTPSRPPTKEELNEPEDSRLGCQFWLNGTGSFLPTIGWLDNYNTHQFPSDAQMELGTEMYTKYGAVHPSSPEPTNHPLALAGVADQYGHQVWYWVKDKEKLASLGVQIAGVTLVTAGQNADYYKTCPDQQILKVEIGDRYWIAILIGNGQAWTVWGDDILAVSYATAKVNIPTTGGYAKIDAVWDTFNAGGVKAWIRAGTNESSSGFATLAVPYTHVQRQYDYAGWITVTHRQSMNDVYYTSTNGGSGTPTYWIDNWGAKPATYVAVLDQGNNQLSHVAVGDADDAWDVITDAAGSEYGSVFWDEAGVFRFWSYDRLMGLQNNPVRAMNLDQITSLRFTQSLDSIRNIISLEGTDRVSRYEVIYSAASADQFYVPAATVSTWSIALGDMQSPSPNRLPRYETIVPGSALPTWDDNVVHGYVVQFLHDDGLWYENALFASGVDVNAYFDFEGNMTLRIYNGYNNPMRLWTDDNKNGLRISGMKLSPVDNIVTITKDLTSVNKYRGRNLKLSGPFYQKFSNANGGIDMLLSQTKNPVPDTEAISIAGDPRLQLGDTIRMTDSPGFGERFDVQIYGVRRRFDVSGLNDTLAVKLVRAPGGIWDSTQYGIWGSTFIWGN